MYVPHRCAVPSGVRRGRQILQNPPEWLSCYVGTGNWIPVPWTASALNLWSISRIPLWHFQLSWERKPSHYQGEILCRFMSSSKCLCNFLARPSFSPSWDFLGNKIKTLACRGAYHNQLAICKRSKEASPGLLWENAKSVYNWKWHTPRVRIENWDLSDSGTFLPYNGNVCSNY